MKRPSRACICAGILVLAAGRAAAFELIGVRWVGGSARFRINANFPDVARAGDAGRQREMILCAASAWREQTRARFEFIYDGETTRTTFNENDGVNIVAFSTADGGDALAATLISGEGQAAMSADVLFFAESDGIANKWNGSGAPPQGEFDIQGVAVHELGHALGLNHTHIAQATMFASATGRALPLRTLHQDDRDGVEAIYTTRTAEAPAATILSVSPDNGPTAGGNEVIVDGVNFTYESDTIVVVDGVQIAPADFSVESCSRIRITRMPAHSLGSVDVEVVNTVGSARAEAAYRYGGPPPRLLSVTPAESALDGGIEVEIAGRDLTPDGVIRVGGALLASPEFISPARIRGIVPPGAGHGSVDVVLVQGVDTVTLPDAFTYNAFALELDVIQAAPGQTGVVLPARATNPVPLSSASFGLVYDSSRLGVLGATTAGTAAADAEFVGANVQNAAGVTTLGIVFDLDGDDVTFPAGNRQPLVKILASVAPEAVVGERVDVGMASSVGDPPIQLMFTRAGSADPIRPLTGDGAVLVITGAAFRRGDANGDGKVDISDPVFLLDFLFRGTTTVRCDDAADSNDDGGLDVSDAVNTLGFLFQGTAPPPAPFPNPGIDPTPDELGCNG